MPAGNGRFGASGGVARPTLECRTATSALVQTAVNPPPAPSRWDVSGNARATEPYSEHQEKKTDKLDIT